MSRLRSTGRREALAAAIVLVTAACGLSVVGQGPDVTAGSGGADAQVAVGDAAPDADAAPPVRCEDVCDAGSCEGGTCVIACNGTSCGRSVLCPPGVPCDVRCSGSSACLEGVDCSRASACKIACSGPASCNNEPVVCSGQSCVVGCTGPGACGMGILCDAGTCDLTCAGAGTCANRPVACNSVDCKVRCGATSTDGTSCAGSVTCNATSRCEVTCTADNSCSNGGVDLRSNGTAQLDCVGAGSCRGNKAISAADGTAHCSGFLACTNSAIYCDGGHCGLSCGGGSGTAYQLDYCCTAPTECASTEAPPCSVVRPTCP